MRVPLYPVHHCGSRHVSSKPKQQSCTTNRIKDGTYSSQRTNPRHEARDFPTRKELSFRVSVPRSGGSQPRLQPLATFSEITPAFQPAA
jgi:hypothetical protein